MLDALLHDCREFAAKVARGEAQLKGGAVDIAPPAPLPRASGGLPLKVL